MIISVQAEGQDCVRVTYENDKQVLITTDNGTAEVLADYLLSPRSDMTRSEYLRIMQAEDEVTEIVAVQVAA